MFTSTILGRPVQRDLNAHRSARFTLYAPVPRRHCFIRPGSQALRHHHSELPSLAGHHPPGPVQPEVVCPLFLSLRCIMGMLLAFIANRAGTYLSCSTVCLTSCSCLHVPYNALAPWGAFKHTAICSQCWTAGRGGHRLSCLHVKTQPV